jgi:hypothetical protein
MNIKKCASFIVIGIIFFILFIISIIYIIDKPCDSKACPDLVSDLVGDQVGGEVYYYGNNLNKLFNIDYNDTITKRVKIRKNNGETCTIDALYQAKKSALENGLGKDIPESMVQTFVGDCEPLKGVVRGEGIEWLDNTKVKKHSLRGKHIVRRMKKNI